MSSHLPRIQLPQTHSIPPQFYPHPHHQHPRPFAHHQVNHVQTVSESEHPRPISAEHLSSYIVNAITHVISQHQHQTREHFQSIETSLRNQLAPLSQTIEDFGKKTDAGINDLAQLIKKSNDVHQRAIQTVANRIMDLERLVGGCGKGKQEGYGDTKTILDRLDAISFAVEDLLERAQDPQANKEPTLMRDAATDPIPRCILHRNQATSPIPELVHEPEKFGLSSRCNEIGTSPFERKTFFPSHSITPESSVTRHASHSVSLEAPDNTSQILCTLSPADWTKNGKSYFDQFPPSSDEVCRVVGSPAPALVDVLASDSVGHDGGLNHEHHDESTEQQVEDCHSLFIGPSAPEPSSHIDPEDDLLKPTVSSTPARTPPSHSVSQAISPVYDNNFDVPSSGSPSPGPSHPQSVALTFQPMLDAQSPTTVVHDDVYDEQSVERMVTAPTPSMVTPEIVKTEPQNEVIVDTEISDLTSLGSDDEDNEGQSDRMSPSKRRRLADDGSLTEKRTKSGVSSSSKHNSHNMKSSATKETLTRKRRSRKKRIHWPQRIIDDSEGTHNRFIQCDKCRLWFHWGCVGLKPDDPILLDANQQFACPACFAGRRVEKQGSNEDPRCSRPDCDQNAHDEFFVSGLIGRRTKVIDGEMKYVWLIRWLGYPVCKATWEVEDSFNDPRLIQQFNQDVEVEGFDDCHSCILLREALEGGWNPDEPDITPLDTSHCL